MGSLLLCSAADNAADFLKMQCVVIRTCQAKGMHDIYVFLGVPNHNSKISPKTGWVIVQRSCDDRANENGRQSIVELRRQLTIIDQAWFR